jgi:hypothetical protein
MLLALPCRVPPCDLFEVVWYLQHEKFFRSMLEATVGLKRRILPCCPRGLTYRYRLAFLCLRKWKIKIPRVDYAYCIPVPSICPFLRSLPVVVLPYAFASV